MPRRCDIWRIGLVHAPVARVVEDGFAGDLPISWLPGGRPFSFDADPFGLWRDGRLHLFVEHYDYRTRHGVIDRIELDEALRPVARQTVLREPWHLSYPFVFEAEGETWMLPEAYRSGRLTLYRAAAFPDRWEPCATLPLDSPAIDPTLLRHDGRWWLFYSASADRERRLGSLHIAWADALTGPWHVHPGNPIRLDRGGARPGGVPFLLDGEIVLPVQDCSRTYGGAIRLLHFAALTPDRVDARLGRRIAPGAGFAPFDAGLHTLAACGPVTLIDAKRIDRSGRGLAIDLVRGWRRLTGGLRAAP